MEMFEKYVTLGNAEEVCQRYSQWIEQGLEHMVVADTSGVAGTVEQAFDHVPELQKLPGLIESLNHPGGVTP